MDYQHNENGDTNNVILSTETVLVHNKQCARAASRLSWLSTDRPLLLHHLALAGQLFWSERTLAESHCLHHTKLQC